MNAMFAFPATPCPEFFQRVKAKNAAKAPNNNAKVSMIACDKLIEDPCHLEKTIQASTKLVMMSKTPKTPAITAGK